MGVRLQLAWGPSLDPATFMFCIAMFGFLMAGLSFGSARALGSDTAGLVEWGKSMSSAGGAFLLYFFRGHLPEWATFLVANVLVIGVGAFALRAHARELSQPEPWRPIAAAVAFGMAGVLAAHFLDMPREVAGFTLSVALAALLGRMTVMLVRHGDWRTTPSAKISIASMSVLAVFFTLRAALVLAGAGPQVALPRHGTAQVLVMIAAALFVVAASVGFLLMVHDRQRKDAVESARRDGLTGLLNRTAFFTAAERMASEDRRPFAIVMIDIDRFKRINDSHGHAGGDATIEHAAALIARSVRAGDLVGRYGGEEFCVLLRDCDAARARAFCDRLVADAASQQVALPGGGLIAYTLSAGYAGSMALPADPALRRPFKALVERADRALYAAKRAGRNQAVAG